MAIVSDLPYLCRGASLMTPRHETTDAAAAAAVTELRAARVAAIAAALRVDAEATHASLVEQEASELATHAQTLEQLDQSAESAAAATQQAEATVQAAERALNNARAEESAIAARRREATMTHMDVMRALSYRIATLRGKLTDEHWLVEAEARVAAEENA